MKKTTALNQRVDLQQISEEVIAEFFEDYSLEDTQHYLWQLFKLAFSGNVGELQPFQRDNIAVFFERLVDVLPSIIHQHKLKQTTH